MPAFPVLPRGAVRAVALIAAGSAVAVTAALNPLAFAVNSDVQQQSVETSRPPITSGGVTTWPDAPSEPGRPTVTMTLTQVPPGGFPPGSLPSGPTLPPWTQTFSSGAQPGAPTVTGAPLPTNLPTTTSVPTSTSVKPTSAKPTSAPPTSAKPTSAKPTSQRPTSNRPTSNRPTSQRP